MTEPKPRSMQIVGFRMEPDLAKEMKEEAARRGTSLKSLIIEMWAAYKAKKSA